MIEQQLEIQREQYSHIMENSDMEKAARHDLRHHLTVVGQLAEDERKTKEQCPFAQTKISTKVRYFRYKTLSCPWKADTYMVYVIL